MTNSKDDLLSLLSTHEEAHEGAHDKAHDHLSATLILRDEI